MGKILVNVMITYIAKLLIVLNRVVSHKSLAS